MNRRLVFFVFLFFPFFGFAQTNADYQKKYQAGKQQIADGKYAQAHETLRPLLRVTPANAYVAYAHYYSALASFKNKQPAEAKLMLTQLLEKFPNWKQADEARYLLANMALESADYNGALSTLKSIRGSSLKADVVGMIKHYLSQIKEVSSLKKIQAANSENAAVAEVLVDKLLSAPPTKDDQALASALQKQFKLNRQAKTDDTPTIQKKEGYNVAVLFPFQLDKLNTNQRDNQFALDMYEGLKLGKEKLAEEGIKINVFAYDVANDANKALELVNSPEFSGMDLLIGPLYAETNKVATIFSNTRQIALINPISYNQKILQGNPFSFLAQTSPELQANKAAEYATKNFQPNSALIFYGTTPDDSLMAGAYRDKVKATGGKVLIFKKMPTSQFGTALQDLNSGKIGHIFLSTSSQSVAATFMSALAEANSQIPVITTPNLLDFQMIGYDQYERRNVHFIYPDYVNHDSDSVKTFISRYFTENNIIPSTYSFQGYDQMVFFGHLLNQYGLHFQDGLHRQPPTKAMTLSGFDYTGSNANQYVPLRKFEQSRLVTVNKIE